MEPATIESRASCGRLEIAFTCCRHRYSYLSTMISQLVPKGCRGREQKRPQDRGHAGNDRGGTRWTRCIPACAAKAPLTLKNTSHLGQKEARDKRAREIRPSD